jgi:hypothetical protein
MPKQVVNLNDTVSLFRDKVNIISTDVGWRGDLTTTEKTDIVSALNEIDAELGTISAAAMGTTASTISGAIAELETEIDVLNTKVEQTQSITTTATTLADAINELDAELGTITPAAMGTAASTVSAAIAELQSEILLLDSNAVAQLAQIGNLASLDTTAKNNLVAAINELDDRIDTDTDFRNKVSATDAGGDGSFGYNQSSGVFTYTGPSASEARAHFSGGNEITITSGSIAHDNISRTNTTSSDSASYGGTFTVIDSLTSNARGHITAANTKTIALPGAYSHPTHPGDDASIDTGALTGATVISDLDLNITTDTLGHVTDTNATVATRTLTLANLGYTGTTDANTYVHPNHTGAVTSTADGATQITGSAVTTAKINNLAVTNGKLADGAVNAAKLTSAVTLIIYNSAGTAVKTLYGAGS